MAWLTELLAPCFLLSFLLFLKDTRAAKVLEQIADRESTVEVEIRAISPCLGGLTLKGYFKELTLDHYRLYGFAKRTMMAVPIDVTKFISSYPIHHQGIRTPPKLMWSEQQHHDLVNSSGNKVNNVDVVYSPGALCRAIKIFPLFGTLAFYSNDDKFIYTGDPFNHKVDSDDKNNYRDNSSSAIDLPLSSSRFETMVGQGASLLKVYNVERQVIRILVKNIPIIFEDSLVKGPRFRLINLVA
ncbi:hypothetical protein HPP92_023606 [Vanilla planifolia]|uniref:Uncharacterized protein n=1 Tax=Vanilla planifolia TaxID=51239 RepID=A0A835PN81_VANPL|nr:hypothetical protein HPP92_023606 [Vanilla planifolia]